MCLSNAIAESQARMFSCDCTLTIPVKNDFSKGLVPPTISILGARKLRCVNVWVFRVFRAIFFGVSSRSILECGCRGKSKCTETHPARRSHNLHVM